jgi:hypothetical protein
MAHLLSFVELEFPKAEGTNNKAELETHERAPFPGALRSVST